MKFTACLLVALAAMAADAAILPLPLYHPAAYNLVQPLAVVPSNAWSTFVRSNVIGGSYAYAVQNNEALHAISSNIQPPVVAIHLPDASAGYPLVANALHPQWVVQQGAGGFTFIPAGGIPVTGVAVGPQPGAPGAPGAPAAPPSVDAGDVVTVSDEADGESAANVNETDAEPEAPEAGDAPAPESDGDQANEAESTSAADYNDADSESVESA